MGKSQLIHNNEFHLISKAEIRKATGKLVESLNLNSPLPWTLSLTKMQLRVPSSQCKVPYPSALPLKNLPLKISLPSTDILPSPWNFPS